MPDVTAAGRPSVLVTALLAAGIAGLWLAVWPPLVHGPRWKKTFDEYGLQLPGATKAVYPVADWVALSWWPALPASLLTAVGWLGWLRHQPGWARAATGLAGLAAAGLLAANLVVWVALALMPWAKLREGLYR